ncbi:hypothetical protein EYF80_000067 [Liparis tanakae]|uniref:Uncharacterized protein n=1 Tax=Liparis tanakae TaxID=230148 RepID=A0A4Z2JI86_9TELE|nr:hypothetical protein EYF80_000067 [Liparis tanakae]
MLAAGSQGFVQYRVFFVFVPGPRPHTWLLPLVLVSRPSVDREEGGRGRGPTGVAACEWLTCETTSTDSQRSSSSLTSLSISSLWTSRLTSMTPSSSRPSTSLLLSTALSMVSNFTITASILDTMLPIECSILSTRLTSLGIRETQVVSHLLVFMLRQLLVAIVIVLGKDCLDLCVRVALSEERKQSKPSQDM